MKKINQTKTKEKSVSGAIRNTCDENHFDDLTANLSRFSFLDYAESQQNLQLNLMAKMKPAPKVIRLFRCFCCEKSFALRKMSNCLVVCRTCHRQAQSKGKIAKNNFTDRTLNKILGFLRG